MKAATKIDLTDMQDCMEALIKRWPSMSLAEQIDVAARLKAVGKHCETIDKSIKDAVKSKLKDKAGVVPGELFKAVMRLDAVTRLDQTMLKVEYPKIHAACTKPAFNKVITFEVR
jgi:predicted phage-related endonuclease